VLLGPDKVAAYVLRAQTHLSRRSFSDAIKDYNEAIGLARGEEKARALFGRAIARYESGDKPGAVADYGAVLALTPKDATALNNRCWIELEQNALEAARKDCEAAIALEPDTAFIVHSMGRVLEKSGDEAGAAAHYARAASLSPEESDYQRDAKRVAETSKHN